MSVSCIQERLFERSEMAVSVRVFVRARGWRDSPCAKLLHGQRNGDSGVQRVARMALFPL